MILSPIHWCNNKHVNENFLESYEDKKTITIHAHLVQTNIPYSSYTWYSSKNFDECRGTSHLLHFMWVLPPQILHRWCFDELYLSTYIPIPAPIFPLYPDLGHGTVFLFIRFLAIYLMKGSWGESLLLRERSHGFEREASTAHWNRSHHFFVLIEDW